MSSSRKGGVGPPNDALERLYAADPEEFVAERTRLARLLRDEGRDEEAADLAAQRKPSLPVFAANRLARTHADDVAELVATAERLAAAHRSGDAETLREAQDRMAERVRALVRAAAGATGRSLSEPVEQRLAALLRSAAVDSTSASLLRRGVLSAEVEPTGFDALAGMPLPPRGRREDERSTDRRAERDSRRRASQARIERLEGELAEARDALRAAEKQLSTVERDVQRARRRVADLTDRLERARQAV